MSTGDFVCTSANDGTHYFRPITARAQTFWQQKGFNTVSYTHLTLPTKA